MSGHTPGPWVVYTPEDYDGPECLPGLGVESQTTGDAVVWSALEPETGLKNDADARLIAAAPDLLEALEMIAKPIFAHANGDEGPYVTDDEFDEWHERFLITARAAIAKARGAS